MAAPYNGTSGDVDCGTSGYFTILNNSVTSNSSCEGLAAIPQGVTSIAPYVLSNTDLITEVTIPSSVTLIDNFAFANLPNLVDLRIAEGSSLTLNWGAFYNASALTSLVIPSSVTSIGYSVFGELTSLTSLTIPDSVTSIGLDAFSNLAALTSLTIPSSVTEIGDEAFLGASSITSLNIPSGVTSIGDAAFYNTTSLRTLTIPNSVTSIGFAAFYETSNLLSYRYCGDNFTTEELFYLGLIGTRLPCVSAPTAPTSVTATSTSATTANVSFIAPVSDGGVEITSYTATSSPDGVTGTLSQAGSGTIEVTGLNSGTRYTFTVTATNSVGTSAASSESNSVLTNYVGPSGDVACGTSGYFTILNNVVTGGTDCAGSVVIPDAVTSIAYRAFYGADFITSVTIGNNLASIGNNAFYGAAVLTSLTIGSGATSIGNNAFYGADSLTSVTIGNNAVTIGNYAFYGTDSLTSVTIGSGASSIGDYAFYGADSLTSVTIGSGAISIGDYAFYGADSLTSLTIPNSVTYIGTIAFLATSELLRYQYCGDNFTTEELFDRGLIGTRLSCASIEVASISSLSFISDGTGTGGKLVWAGKYISSVLFTGPEAAYPGPYNYGTFTSGWNGRIRNLTPDTSYTISIFAISADGLGESKSLTFTTTGTPWPVVGVAKPGVNRSEELSAQLPRLFTWIDENTFVNNEGDRMKRLLNRFQTAQVLSGKPYLALPNSRLAKVSAISLTPSVCTVESGVKVKSISAGTCTISYTVSDTSRAPATLVKDFVFRKFAK
jgi:hypothetical protein